METLKQNGLALQFAEEVLRVDHSVHLVPNFGAPWNRTEVRRHGDILLEPLDQVATGRLAAPTTIICCGSRSFCSRTDRMNKLNDIFERRVRENEARTRPAPMLQRDPPKSAAKPRTHIYCY